MSKTPSPKKQLNFSIDITAPREKIWDTLIGKETFEKWCHDFNPYGGSTFEGDWSVGGTMKFLGPDDEGNVGGMITKITEHRPGEYIRSEATGIIGNGTEYYEGEMYDEWVPSIEEYRLTGGPDTYTLTISNDVPEPMYDYFAGIWPNALKKVKEMAEGR